MKNLALLIDTNVILNYLLKRDDNQLDESTTIMLKCAKDVNADFIVTCNINDYNNSEVEAITPKKILKKVQY
jgi:predicted nucleic acid-binding protein